MTIPNLATPAPGGPLIGLLSETSFTQLVNTALRNYQSTLALSRSELANSALVTPTLVKDEASPTAEERGHGLRLVLQWAINQLAPGAPAYPPGHYRPLDDPTWRDPRWWRYNILRHRYLEPLHPDDFVADGRYTESLIALTGISSTDAFFDERNRAIRTVADHLRQQLIDGSANAELQRLALQEALLPLKKQPEADKLLGIAATFEDIFPRSLLLELGAQEPIKNPAGLLEQLVAHRFLLPGDAGSSLWLSPVLRAYIYQQQNKDARQARHRLAAAYYERQGEALLAARHWQRAQQDDRAVRVILPVTQELVHELQMRELIDLLRQLDARRLTADQWYTVQLLLSDLFQRSGQHDEALAACRLALKASEEPDKQARVYRRMGKLYESHNQLHALRYYQQAIERFAPDAPELATVFKDRGWVYCLRQDWERAERDLQQALQTAPPDAKLLQADIYDAIASLNRETGNHRQALAFAERALALREEVGDLLRVAKSHGNLGLLYRAMGENIHAIAAYREAMATYKKIGNQELTAAAWLNIGAAYYREEQAEEEIKAYVEVLAICQETRLPLVEIKARYNLALALSTANRPKEAIVHWQAGYQLCQQYNFDDLEADFIELQKTTPALQAIAVETMPDQPSAGSAPTDLDGDEKVAFTIAQREHSVTAKRLMEIGNVSRATATRRLSTLAEKGYLEKRGEGRGTYYVIAEPTTPAMAAAPPNNTKRIQAKLTAQQAQLAATYGVLALDLAPGRVPTTSFHVRFATLPSLEQFFALEEYLSSQLGVIVDLKPQLPNP